MLVIPLGPEDREVRRWPWVIIGIVALNVLVFVLAGPSERSAGDPQGLAARWGFIPGDPSPWSAVTAAFVHSNFRHLAANMIFLLATGPFLEDAYGRVLFPVIYLVSTISGCYAYGELGGERWVRLVGASNASFGVEGAFAVRFGARYLRFLAAESAPHPSERVSLRREASPRAARREASPFGRPGERRRVGAGGPAGARPRRWRASESRRRFVSGATSVGSFVTARTWFSAEITL